MKKITLLLAFLCISLLANAQATCNQTFTAAGQDDGPTVLTINAADLTCQGAGAITALQLVNSADTLTTGFCTTNGTSWYGFNLSIDGATPIPVCDGEINGTDISGFTTLTITSQDNDNFSDGIDITIDVEVTFTPTTPPLCDATLTSPVNGDTSASVDGILVWSAASGGATGYNLTVGTTPGGNDILASTALGNVTTYNLGALTATTSYYVTIEAFNGNGTATGCIEQTFTTYTPVTGDVCAIATSISCSDAVSGTTVGATSNGAPTGTCGTGAGAPGVWYSFTATGNDIVTASLCGSAFDTKIQIYSGTCGTLTCVGGNDDDFDACGAGNNSQTQFIASTGTDYYIYVFGFGSATGAFDLALTCIPAPVAPPNDECAGAISVPVNTDLNCGSVVNSSINGATASADDNSACGGTANDDVWFSFVATGTVHAVSTTNIMNDTTNTAGGDLYFGVYGGTCGTLTNLVCQDGEQDVVNGLIAGNTYYIRVYSFTSNVLQNFSFDVCVGTPAAPPVNDECIGAIDVPVSPDFNCYTPVSGTITGGTASADITPSCTFGEANDDVWYTFTATNDTHIVNFQNVLGSGPINFSMFEGNCGTLTETHCLFNANGGIVENLVVGNVYYIRAYSNNSVALNNITFDLCVLTPTPPITADITSYVPEELITDVLVDADCSTISNIFYSSHDFNALGGGTGDTNDSGIGYFTDGGSGFPYEEGIILSSGRATEAAGPFDEANVPQESFFAPGDADLEAETGTTGTGDATYIQFDFVPATQTLSFNFIMASSEYNGPDGGFQCQFSDSFAFILTNTTAGTPPVNLAVLPTPFEVSDAIVVTNIHPEIQGQCDAINEQYFGGYALPGAELGYQGRTVPFTAFSNVIPGDTYTIKMVVADEGDTALDTAIFLEAGSFAAFVNIDLNIDVDANGQAFVCPNEAVNVPLSAEGTFSGNETYQWQLDGVDIAGATATTYTATELGEYTIIVDQNGCGATASVNFIETQVIVPVVPDMIQTDTDTDGFMPFDLSVNDILFTDIDPTYVFTYHASQGDAENNLNPLSSPYTNTSNPQTIVVRVQTIGGCVEYVSFQLIVNIIGDCFVVDAGNDQSTDCSSGLCVDLTAAITFNDQACTDAYANLTPVYTWSDISGVLGTGITINVCPNTTTTYTVEAVYTLGDGSTDTATDTVIVNVDPNVPSVNLGSDILTCDTEAILSGTISGVTALTYQWQLNGVDLAGETSDTLNALESGTYTLFVSDLLGCTVEDSVVLTLVAEIDLSHIPDTLEFCDGDSIMVNATVPNSQVGDYTYAWSSGETTEMITVGQFETYTVTITSVLGNCVWTKSIIASQELDGCTVIIPQGISPNNDGVNDCFDLGNLSVSKLTVYNRYGTEVFDKVNYSGEWCGTTEEGGSGSELPTGTYYYVIELNSTNTVNYIGTLQGWVYINREK